MPGMPQALDYEHMYSANLKVCLRYIAAMEISNVRTEVLSYERILKSQRSIYTLILIAPVIMYYIYGISLD